MGLQNTLAKKHNNFQRQTAPNSVESRRGTSMLSVPIMFNTGATQLAGDEKEELLQKKPFQLKGNVIQKKTAHEEEEALQMHSAPFQIKSLEEEEPLQKRSAPFQLKGIEGEEPLQKKTFQLAKTGTPAQTNTRPNQTGMPNNLKAGVEALSGIAMDDVKVHYNSSKPAQLQALAYAQGTDIHIAPGQEKHLPHEAWHVVQQKQGRVQPTRQMKGGVAVNDDKGLESEADVMGGRAGEFGQGIAAASRPLIKGPWAEKDSSILPSAPLQKKEVSQSVLQCYKTLDTEEYELVGESDSDHFFKTQSVSPTVKKEKKDYSISHDISRSNEKQGLLIADDGTLAINNTIQQAKEFYGTDGVVNQANKALASVKSAVKLEKSGNLSISATGKTLNKIVPKPSVAKENAEKKEFDNLVSHICIEMASGVMQGNRGQYSHEAVFQQEGGEDETVVNITSKPDAGDTKIESLATAFTNAPKSLDAKDIRSKMILGVKDELPGRAYGKQAAKGQLNKKAKKLGINQHARPNVGEGYATFSLAGSEDNKTDFLKTGKAREILQNIWGYHFAAVIAKSLDGKDTITLENYNRKADVMEQAQVIIDRLVNSAPKKFKAIIKARENEENKPSVAAELMQVLEIARKNEKGGAQEAYKKIMSSYNAIESWFFKMQGSGKGQSFHEQQADTDGFINPITLRVRPQNSARETLRYKNMAWINAYPKHPALTEGEEAFSGFLEERNALRTAIQNCETTKNIEEAFKNGKNQIAISAIHRAAKAIADCTERSGATGMGKLLLQVKQNKGIAGKASLCRNMGELGYYAIEDNIQKLWVTETEKHMAYAKNQSVVFAAREYANAVFEYWNT